MSNNNEGRDLLADLEKNDPAEWMRRHTRLRTWGDIDKQLIFSADGSVKACLQNAVVLLRAYHSKGKFTLDVPEMQLALVRDHSVMVDRQTTEDAVRLVASEIIRASRGLE